MRLRDQISIAFDLSNIAERFGYYRLSDLQSGGVCGLCGKAIPNVVVPTYWPYAICSDCKNGKQQTCSGCKYCKLGIPCSHCTHDGLLWRPIGDIAMWKVRPYDCPLNMEDKSQIDDVRPDA